MQFNRYDTKVTFTLPKNSYEYFTSMFKTDEIEQISSNPQRVWIWVINKSITEHIVIKKDKTFDFFFFFFILELQNMKRKQKKGNRVKNIEKKTKKSFFK